MIALVVADTSHTRVMRLPGVVWCGTRVHTIPDALATSIAATRSTICSCSSTSTCLPSGTTRAPCPEGWGCGCPGARLGTEALIGVLEATVRDPPDRAPAPNCLTASTTKQASGVGGQPARFSRLHGVPAGDTRTVCGMGGSDEAYRVDTGRHLAGHRRGRGGAAQLLLQFEGQLRQAGNHRGHDRRRPLELRWRQPEGQVLVAPTADVGDATSAPARRGEERL